MDTGPNMIADFLCLVFILMPGKCSVLYLIIRESESVENPKWGAAIIIYFPAISYAAFLGWIHDFFSMDSMNGCCFYSTTNQQLKKKNSYIMQTCLLRDHGEHDGKAKVRGE